MIPSVKKEILTAEFDTESRGDFFRELYEMSFPDVAALIASRGGSLEDAKDIFHDALIDLYEQSRHESFDIRGSLHHYLLGIVRNKWYKKFRTLRLATPIDHRDATSRPCETDAFPDQERLLTLLKRSGERCLQLLEMFFFHQMRARDVAEKNGYANEQVATVQKYKCLQKVRDFVKLKSMTHDDFME